MVKEIEKLRKKIDLIDERIIKLLSERMETSKKIGQIKKERNLDVLDSTREYELKDLHKNLSAMYTIDQEFIADIFELIIKFSKNTQKGINFK